ncbi:MBL fold metallo-hydrolase [Geminicoccus sp.]|uniref:MBL fold metallo-hydrolase n=1 Tax=Geminicoccus sp. TaxID=2024832 RepID=UPI0032C23294
MGSVGELGSTMRVLRPEPGLLAFYDGRIDGVRLHSAAPNWLDDGAFGLGTCTYALVEGDDALVYDTHISLGHARIIRRTLAEAGARRIRVVLSHWHVDHVAGNEVFADCEIIAHRLTAETLLAHRAELENGDPPVRPLAMPGTTYEERLELRVGSKVAELRHADVHSLDGTVLVLPDRDLILAGDTLEDPITYVVEPARLETHLAGLERMAGWAIGRILPNHGAPERIATGGYGPGLIEVTRHYVEKLLRSRTEPALRQPDLRGFMPEAFAAGTIVYHPAYEAVHRRNLAAVA